MSYVKIMVHSVWGTKNRQHILTQEKRFILFNHIRSNAQTKGIYIDRINGYTDHVHCLISLSADQSIARVVQMIKGEASHWANKEGLFSQKFRWADDYYAGGVGMHGIDRVRRYIENQEEHHRKETFEEEYEELLLGIGMVMG